MAILIVNKFSSRLSGGGFHEEISSACSDLLLLQTRNRKSNIPNVIFSQKMQVLLS